MNQNQGKHQDQDVASMNLLLSNLEEHVFFARLSVILKQVFPLDQNEIYQMRADQSAKLVALDGEFRDDLSFGKGESICSYVSKIKRPYFSNNTKRDPLFSQMIAKRANLGLSFESELVYPILVGNTVLACIHLKSNNQYSDADVSRLKDVLSSYNMAFENLNNYLMVKYVNNELMNKFEQGQFMNEKQARPTMIQQGHDEILGFDKNIIQNKLTVERASKGDFPVLIDGELGVGKRFFAKKIHQLSQRSMGPFIILECGVKDEESLEKELFGYMDRAGMFEHAANGTLVLSDINELPLGIQSKLQQALTSGWIVRVNSKERININVRIIATSKVTLNDAIASKKFREDLYYRLSTVCISMPSLSERKDDIKTIADHFLNAGRVHKKFIASSVLKKLEEHRWVANILELKSIMERAYTLSDSECIDMVDFNLGRASASKSEQKALEQEQNDSKDEELTLFELEKRYILKTLTRVGSNKTKAAKALGITVKTLYNKLHSYGVEFEDRSIS